MRSERTVRGKDWVAVGATSAYWVLILAVLPGVLAHAAARLRPQLYDATTETVMPHLEENLRYAITHAERCIGEAELAAVFPILGHPALADCRLEPAQRNVDGATYDLVCEGDHGTTGVATWELGARRLTGTLRVRLGGKNMTFEQRITATPHGECRTGS
jgi:hypothetical protein